MSLGSDWNRLDELDRSGIVIGDLLNLDPKDAKFVDKVGSMLLKEVWPPNAPARAGGFVSLFAWINSLFDLCVPRYPPIWKNLAEDFAADHEFFEWVSKSARRWRRNGTDVTLAQLATAVAWQALRRTIPKAGPWLLQRAALAKQGIISWLKLLKDYERKTPGRVQKELDGRPVGEGEPDRPPHPESREADMPSTAETGGILEAVEGREDDPAKIAEHNDQLNRLRSARRQLDWRKQRILQLRSEGHSFEAIALDVDVALSITRVRQLLEEALDELRRLME